MKHTYEGVSTTKVSQKGIAHLWLLQVATTYLARASKPKFVSDRMRENPTTRLTLSVSGADFLCVMISLVIANTDGTLS